MSSQEMLQALRRDVDLLLNKHEPSDASSDVNYNDQREAKYLELRHRLDQLEQLFSKQPIKAPANSPLIASDHASDGKFHLLLAASGSVASIKIPNIIQGLSHHARDRLSIRLILTSSAAQFLQGQAAEQPSLETISTLPNVDAIYTDMDEWRHPWTRNGPVLHIELRRWAHMLVIAPLSANTLAKLANGICDNLLTSVVRAWEVVKAVAPDGQSESEDLGRQKPIIVAPAMNTMMWVHPATKRHLEMLLEMAGKGDTWIRVLRPKEMTLACGDIGVGGMRGSEEIVAAIEEIMP